MTEQFQKDIFAIIDADIDKFDLFIEGCEASLRLSRSVHYNLELINARKKDKEWAMVPMKKAIINLLNETQTQPRFKWIMAEIIDYMKM